MKPTETNLSHYTIETSIKTSATTKRYNRDAVQIPDRTEQEIT